MTPAAIFRRYFGLSLSAGRVLEALYEAAGEPTSRRDLEDFAGAGPESVISAIAAIEGALDAGGIARLHAGAVALTAFGLAECEQALKDAYRRGRAA